MEIGGKNPFSGLNGKSHRRPTVKLQSHNPSELSNEGSSPDPNRIRALTEDLGFKHLRNMLRSASDVREAKVESLRRAVETGAYYVPAERIAEKILAAAFAGEWV